MLWIWDIRYTVDLHNIYISTHDYLRAYVFSVTSAVNSLSGHVRSRLVRRPYRSV